MLINSIKTSYFNNKLNIIFILTLIIKRNTLILNKKDLYIYYSKLVLS